MKKVTKSLILIASIFTFSLTMTSQTDAKSKTKIKTIKTYKNPKPFLKQNNSKEYIWNHNHTQKIKTLTTIPKKTLYATKLVSMHFPNYQYNVKYYYVKSKDNKIKGYIWHGALTSAKYINNGKYSYYSYPKKNILASTTSITSIYENELGSPINLSNYSNKSNFNDVAKTPSKKEMKTVIDFFSNPKNTKYIPNENINYKKLKIRKIRIVKNSLFNKYNKKIEIPMLQLGLNVAGQTNYSNKMNFWTALEFAKIHGIPQKTFNNKDKKSYISAGGVGFYFPYNYAIQNGNETNIQKIFKSGYGRNKDLTLIENDLGTLRYVKTNSIISIPNDKFELKNNIWIGNTTSFKKIALNANPKKSNTYRDVYSSGFTEFKFINNKWVKDFDINFYTSAKKQNKKMTLIKDNKYTTLKYFDYDTDFKPYLFKSSDFYNKLKENK